MVLDYNSILEDKRKAVANKTYKNNIDQKIAAARDVTDKFQK
jgi:hypothetical protein